VEHFRAVAQRFVERRCALWHDHEFLEVDRVRRLCAPPLMMFIIGTGRTLAFGAEIPG